jgi:hypothetical protein
MIHYLGSFKRIFKRSLFVIRCNWRKSSYSVESVNDILHDTVYRIHSEILYVKKSCIFVVHIQLKFKLCRWEECDCHYTSFHDSQMLISIVCRSHTKFHPYQRDVETTDISLFMPLSKAWLTESSVTQLTLSSQHFIKDSCTEFHKNLAVV